MPETDAEMIRRLRNQTCLQFARTTTTDRVPTLLRRVANDLDRLSPHILVGITFEITYQLDEATITVFFDFNDDD